MHHGGESQEKTRSSKAAPKTAASAVQVADVAPTASAAKWRVTEHPTPPNNGSYYKLCIYNSYSGADLMNW